MPSCPSLHHPPATTSGAGSGREGKSGKISAAFPEPGWMERDFLAAIGKEQQHHPPHREKAAGGEDSGMLPANLLSPPAALRFFICARTLPCLVASSCRAGLASVRFGEMRHGCAAAKFRRPRILFLPCFVFF